MARVTASGTFTQNGTPVDGMFSCTTGGDGTCTIDSGQLLGKQGKATFAVDNVTCATFTS